MRGTRKGLEGLGGLRNTEKGHNDEGIVSFLCMEQSTGAIAYPRKARPPTACRRFLVDGALGTAGDAPK